MPQLLAKVTKRYPTTLGHIHNLVEGEEFYAAPAVADMILTEGLASLVGETPTPVPTPEVDQEKVKRIAEAMQAILDDGDEKALTTSGEPRVKELESLLGENTNADERDAAWELVESA